MSLDYMNNKNSKYNAVGTFVFTGSSTIGILNAGFNVKKILEISNDMVNKNLLYS